MHELGHTLGLFHAWKGSDKYGDATGYMGRSYPNYNWPQRCFNGPHSDMLGWYSDRTMAMPSNEEARLVRLAGTVDYDKTAPDEPVLIKLASNLFVQYNRLKDFNAGTGESLDSVAITKLANGHTQFLAMLRPGESYSYGSISIQACQRVTSASGGADVMLASIGTGAAVCDQADKSPTVSVLAPEQQTQLPSTEAEAEATPFPDTEVEATPAATVPVESSSEPNDRETTSFPTAAPISSSRAPKLDANSDATEEPPFHSSFDHSQWWQKFWSSLFH